MMGCLGVRMADGKLLPAYLVVGEDEFRRSRVVDRMRARLEKSGMADFNLDERDLSKDVDVADLMASLNTLPMGSDFRLVILTGCDRLPKDVSEPLIGYLAAPCDTTVCLVVAEKLAKNTRLYKALAKVGPKAVVDCAPKKAWELPKEVVKMAASHGKSMGQPAAQELVSRAGEDSRLLDNEVRRLAQQVAGSEITLADVERLVVQTAEAKPWPLLDAVAARDLRRSLELLRLQPPNSEVLVYTLLTGRVRELICAKAVAARGGGARELAGMLKKADWQVKNHLSWARRWTSEELEDALRGAVDVELALKGSRDSALALERWVVSMAGREAA